MNIIFYSQNGSSEYAQMMIDKNEDFVIREFKFDEVKNYKEVNPGVLIMDAPINKIKDVCMVTKFETSVLIVADEIPSDLTVRADSYDCHKDTKIYTQKVKKHLKSINKCNVTIILKKYFL